MTTRHFTQSIGLLFVVLSTFAWAEDKGTTCETMERKLRLMGRASPVDSFLKIQTDEPRPVKNFTEEDYKQYLAATHTGKAFDGRDIKLRLASPEQFIQAATKFTEAGFWLIFNPSGLNDRAKLGHTTILINGWVFNRMGDGLGADAMRSYTATEVAGAVANNPEMPFVTAQYFELSPARTKLLEKFFHDRVYMYHHDRAQNKNTAYNTNYAELPFTRDKTGPDQPLGKLENCAVFASSFALPLWLKERPELAEITKELGSYEAAHLPNQHAALNHDSPAYRCTILMAKDLESIRKDLEKDGLQTHPYGENLAYTAPFTPIP